MTDLKKAIIAQREKGWKALTDDQKKTLLADKRWRMNNLYYIRDKNGDKVLFKMNYVQKWLLNNLWYLNICLKARQMGMTTFIDLYILDECIFNKGVEAGIIAHNKEDASKIFRRKIKYPYENLPDDIKDNIWPTTDSKTEMIFSNGSVVSVGVSLRSSTCQYLHISEHGKICAKYPDKAEELKSGALEAIGIGQIVFIESTAEGRGGDFYEYCVNAKRMEDEGIEFTEMDFKLHFFAWWMDPTYVLPNPERVVITADLQQYFEDLWRQHGIELTAGQKAWYVKKAERQGDTMKREYPSTWEEAFEASIKGAYWAEQIATIRNRRQITKVPWDPALQVHTAWDLGRNDFNPIWFFQHYGNQYRIIDFYTNNGESLAHYAGLLRRKHEDYGYVYGNHYLPHDVEVTDISADKSRKETLESLGVKSIITVKREASLDSMKGVEAVRAILPMCWFDKEKCAEGLNALEAFQKEWDDKLATYKNRPLHNWASDASMAFTILARGYQPIVGFNSADIEPEAEEAY